VGKPVFALRINHLQDAKAWGRQRAPAVARMGTSPRSGPRLCISRGLCRNAPQTYPQAWFLNEKWFKRFAGKRKQLLFQELWSVQAAAAV